MLKIVQSLKCLEKLHICVYQNNFNLPFYLIFGWYSSFRNFELENIDRCHFKDVNRSFEGHFQEKCKETNFFVIWPEQWKQIWLSVLFMIMLFFLITLDITLGSLNSGIHGSQHKIYVFTFWQEKGLKNVGSSIISRDH